MARHIIETVTDDINNDEDATTVTFSVNGIDYEIDMAERSQAKFDKALAPFIGAARRVGGRRKTGGSSSKRQDLAAAREWLRANGHQVSDRGRISAELMALYDAH